MELYTPRCLIRPFAPEDLEDFMAYRNDAAWMKYQGFKGLSRREYQAALLGKHTLEQGLQLAVVLRDSGRLAGDLYLRREGGDLWLGFTVSPARAGQGYAREAAARVLEWAGETGFRCVLAHTHEENLPSAALLRRLGFRQAGREEELLLFVFFPEGSSPPQGLFPHYDAKENLL